MQGGPSCWMRGEAGRGCGGRTDGRGLWKMNGFKSHREQLPAGPAPGSRGAEAEICFYLCSGSGRIVRREMAEQLGAKAAPVTEQSAG